MSRPVGPSGLGVPVPPGGPGVCATCHGPARDGRRECWCCRAVAAALGHGPGPSPVVPVALCRTGDRLHSVLRGYKDAPAVAARRHFARGLGVHLAGFLSAHGACIAKAAGSHWDSVAVVPSSARNPGARCRLSPPHPLAEVLGSIPHLSGLASVEISRGPGSVDHLAPAAKAFEVAGEAAGRRVLLVDDTWVTGARMQSAAAALVEGGAQVVAMVVAGRAVGSVDPASVPALERWWRWAEARGRRVGEVARGPCCMANCARERPG
ncbi:MAG TPA: hypothetical protein VK215_09830 [Acidimicrobiales bacterium]|nr:hypothetical protein [Acidimicrobiales bacterium]HLN42743.1 hypothetical protein [Acidimicrobiales bacterium]